MKKIVYIIILLIGFCVNSQTPFPTGIRLPNATLSDTLSTQTRIPIMQANSGNLINKYIPIDSIGSYLDYNDLINKPTFKVVQNEYANITGLYSDQSNQTATYIQYVLDATGFPDVTSGGRYFEYLGTTNGDATDYRLLSEDEKTNLLRPQAPYLESLIPDTYLPSTTGNFILMGSYFIPEMCNGVIPNAIQISGDNVINYATFVNDNKIIVNLTTSDEDGMYDITLNNGLVSFYSGALQVVNGTVYQPLTASDWTNIIEPIDFPVAGKVGVETWLSQGSGTWVQELDYTKDWSISFNFIKSPLGIIPDSGDYNFFNLLNISDDSVKFSIDIRPQGYATPLKRYYFHNNTYLGFLYEDDVLSGSFDITMKWIGGVFYIYSKGVLKYTHPTLTFTENVRVQIKPKDVDIENIKYIDLSDDSGNIPDPIFYKASNIGLDATNFDKNLDNTITDVQKLADAVDELVISGGGTDDQTASEVPFTPYGTIAATNVQDAIEEVLDEIPTSLAAANITVSPAIGGNTDAYAVMQANRTSIDSIQANMSSGVNTAFRSVTSTSGVFTESYDADQPNFQLTLDEDVEIEITDAVNGDFLIAEIVNPEDEPFLVTFIGSDKEYLIEGGEISVFSMITNADDETIWIKSVLEDAAYKEISATGSVDIDFKNYDFIKLNVEDETYLEFINPRKNVANLTLHLENKEGVPYDIHFPDNSLFKTLGQGPTIELGSDKLGVFKFDYRDGGFICTSYEVEYDIPVVHTYTIVRRANTGSTSDITATDGLIDWQNGFGGGAGGPLNNLQVTTGNNLATTSVTWTKHGSIPSSMPDADFQTLFDSERWDESGGSEMKYTFSSMSAGTYKVRIYMGESNGSATVGTRVFDIKIQGSTVESNVDMVAKFGGNQIAGMVEYDNIIVIGTTLDVEWIHVTENPVVNGIEILKRD